MCQWPPHAPACMPMHGASFGALAPTTHRAGARTHACIKVAAAPDAHWQAPLTQVVARLEAQLRGEVLAAALMAAGVVAAVLWEHPPQLSGCSRAAGAGKVLSRRSGQRKLRCYSWAGRLNGGRACGRAGVMAGSLGQHAQRDGGAILTSVLVFTHLFPQRVTASRGGR